MVRQQGISLVEVIVGLCLASLLMTLVMQLYLKTKQNYLVTNTLVEENFDLQLVSDLIRDSLRKAGFTPCLSLQYLQSLDSRQSRTGLAALETNGKDTLAIHRMSEFFYLLRQQISPTQLVLQPTTNLTTQQTILIADCYHAEVHQIAKVYQTKSGTFISLVKSLTFHFVAPVYIGEWIEEKFFIQKNKRGEKALFYQQKHTEELSTRVKELFIKPSTQGAKLIRLQLIREQSDPLVIETQVRAQ